MTAVGELTSTDRSIFKGGTGTAVAYPGPTPIDATNVTYRTPSGPAIR